MKVGDKVRCIEPDERGRLTLNQEYVISYIKEDGGPSSEFLCMVYGLNEFDDKFFLERFEPVEGVTRMVVNEQGGIKEVVGKLRWTLLPINALREVVKVLEYGATKYKEKDNWKKVNKDLYKDALWRHWVAYQLGEKNDPETGLSHLAHLLCDGLFLLWFDLKEERDED